MNIAALQQHYPLFDKIIAIFPGAAIAGGFLRDTLMGKPVSDLDIFWTGFPSHKQLADLGALCNTVVDSEPNWQRLKEEYNDGDDRESCMDYLFEGQGVDLICVPDVRAHIHDFPDNISKVWYASNTLGDSNCLWRDASFIYGHANKVIRCRSTAPEARIEKLKAKYPDYSVAFVPPLSVDETEKAS
jgi:hypothetical protein